MHTPGPWHVGKAGMDRLIYADSEHAWDLAIVRNGGNDGETITNANLIAASPDLLVALREMTELAAGPVGGVTVAMKRAILAKARDAIAKAESKS